MGPAKVQEKTHWIYSLATRVPGRTCHNETLETCSTFQYIEARPRPDSIGNPAILYYSNEYLGGGKGGVAFNVGKRYPFARPRRTPQLGALVRFRAHGSLASFGNLNSAETLVYKGALPNTPCICCRVDPAACKLVPQHSSEQG